MHSQNIRVNPIKSKFSGFPRTVEMLEEGEYYGRIKDIYLNSDKTKIVIKVIVYVDDNKEISMSKQYDNEAKVTCSSKLWWFLNAFGLISKGEKIMWEKLQNVETVTVEIAHGEYGCYIKNIKPCNEDEAEDEEYEDDSDYEGDTADEDYDDYE